MTGGVGWTLVCGPQREWARLALIYPRGAVTRAQLALCLPGGLSVTRLLLPSPPSRATKPGPNQMELISN